MKSFILLENIEIYAHHGFFEQETKVGNTFIINVKVEVENVKACQNDNLDGTVNYAEIYGIIEKEMKIPSKLLENVGYRIINRLRSEYKSIQHIELKISKKNPPIGAQIEFASIILID